MHNAEFIDPRLIDVYDAESPWARDDDYFVTLVNETPGARVLDLGCGTAGSLLDWLRLGTPSPASIPL